MSQPSSDSVPHRLEPPVSALADVDGVEPHPDEPSDAAIHEPPDRHWRAAYLLLLLVVSCLATRPLMLQLGTAVPVGPQPAATVPLFNIWTVWWNADRMSHGLHGYWRAPIFHPTPGAFSFSEAQPTLWAVAPIAWLASPAAAYNVYLLASLVLNGWFGCRLLLRLGYAEGVAAAGGVMCLLLPYVHWQIAVLQLIPLWGVLWTLTALDELAESPSLRRGAVLGAAFGVTYLMCNYYGLFLSVLLAVCAPWLLWRRWLERRTWGAIVAAAVVAAVLTAPVVCVQLHYLREHQFSREFDNIASLSTEWRDFLVPRGCSWLPHKALNAALKPRYQLSPGSCKWVLAIIGVAAGLASGVRRRMAVFWMLLLASSLTLSSAANVRAGEWNLQVLLMDAWPGFAQVRTMYRYSAFAQIAIVILAVEGISAIRRGFVRVGRVRLGAWAAAALCVLAAADVLPVTPRLTELPGVEAPGHWATWLRDETPADTVVARLPFVSGYTEKDHEVSALAMYYQTVHHRRMVEGYSGFFPESFRVIRDAMTQFPDESSLHLLWAFGVRYCIVDLSRFSPEQEARLGDWSQRLKLRYVDEPRATRIYELLPAPQTSRTSNPDAPGN